MDLLELAERCEQATGPDREIDTAIFKELVTYRRVRWDDDLRQPGEFWNERGFVESVPNFTASLDAAMTLVPEGWYWQVGQGNHAWAAAYENPIPPSTRVDPIAATPALALCAAALRARATLAAMTKGEE